MRHHLARSYNEWLDKRTWRLQRLLLERAHFWFSLKGCSFRRQGPKLPRKVETLSHLPETHPAHIWGPLTKFGGRSCLSCGLLMSAKWATCKVQWALSLPCIRNGHDLRMLGVHTSHELVREGANWKCKGCKHRFAPQQCFGGVPSRWKLGCRRSGR